MSDEFIEIDTATEDELYLFCMDNGFEPIVHRIAELRKENERLKAALLDTTWQDHADHWQKRALVAEQQLAEANKLIAAAKASKD